MEPLIDFCRGSEFTPTSALQAYPLQSAHLPVPRQQPPPQQFMHATQTSPMLNEISPLVNHSSLPGPTSSPQPGHYPSPNSSQTSQTGAPGPPVTTTPLMGARSLPQNAAPQTKTPAQTAKRRRGSTAVTNKDDDDAVPQPKMGNKSGRIGVTGARGNAPGKRLRSDG
jgi:hypothetical protein